MRFLSTLLALAIFGVTGCSTFKDEPKVLINVHSQGSDMDSSKTIFRKDVDGQQVIFKVIPEVTHKNVIAVHPFPADDGSYGVALKLDFNGTNALDLVTRMRRGEMLLSMVNGVVVNTVVIDRPVSDGIFTIWRGLSEEVVAELEKTYPPIKSVKSSSEFIEMTPSTKKEKREARKRASRDEKAKAAEEREAAKKRARGEFDPEAPNGESVPLDTLLKNP